MRDSRSRNRPAKLTAVSGVMMSRVPLVIAHFALVRRGMRHYTITTAAESDCTYVDFTATPNKLKMLWISKGDEFAINAAHFFKFAKFTLTG